jgi:hypothetical protein
LALDGWQAPLAVYAVQGLVQRRAGAPQRAPQARSPFVGRQRELALLHDRFEAVRAGAGQVASLVGLPGIGKTRLLMEFGRGLGPDQVTWYIGQCWEPSLFPGVLHGRRHKATRKVSTSYI